MRKFARPKTYNETAEAAAAQQGKSYFQRLERVRGHGGRVPALGSAAHTFGRSQTVSARVLIKKTRSGPLRTVHELAQELGVTAVSLTWHMYADPTGPRPNIQTKSSAGRRTYYDPREVRTWFAANGSDIKRVTQAVTEDPQS